ncbi:MAG: hypothetical protein RMI43_04415 [Candidatus Caldarchaeum sp.]|nr:hypothetical protein [Candidatus Caldarchaeum sp.]
MAKTALIPPPNETTTLFFILLLACVTALHILLLVLGSRKLHVPEPVPALHQPITERTVRLLKPPPPTKEATTANVDKPPEDFAKRLEKLDQILTLLEKQVQISQERPDASEQPQPAVNTETPEPTPDAEEIIRMAKSLKEEIHGIMTAKGLSR